MENQPKLTRRPVAIIVAAIVAVAVAGLASTRISKLIPSGPPATTPTTPPTLPTTTTSIYTQQQAGSETGAPVINNATGQQIGVKCPADYCLNPVKGAGLCPEWSGVNGTYYEQECYNYPASANTLTDCEKQKIVYYKVCGVTKS